MGRVPTQKWYELDGTGKRLVTIPSACLVVAYATVFLTAPIRLFALSLIGLIPVALGYIGLVFRPSFEGVVDPVADDFIVRME